MSKLMDVSDADVATIEEVIAERIGMGISQAVAQRQAVDEALAQLAEERTMVMKAVQEQLGSQAEPAFANKSTAPDWVPADILALPEPLAALGVTQEHIDLHNDMRKKRDYVESDPEFATTGEKTAATKAHRKYFNAIGELGNVNSIHAAISRHVDGAGAPAYSNKQSPIGFYSALSTAIDNVPMKASPAQGWKDTIKGLVNKGAVKADEVEWTGLNDWLDLQEGRVTKEAVVGYLDANGVQVSEVTLGGDKQVPKQLQDYVDYYGGDTRTTAGLLEIAREAEQDAQRFQRRGEPKKAEERFQIAEIANAQAERGEVGSEATKYAQYTLPGGENYREVLLTLPIKEKKNTFEARDTGSGYWEAWNNTTGESEQEGTEQEVRAYVAETSRKLSAPIKTADYRSSHWDAPNVLAHTRVNDRTDADGNKVLFVEEVQSDWGQDGKKKGFAEKTPTLPTGYRAEQNKDGKWVMYNPMGGRLSGTFDTEQAAVAVVLARKDLMPGVPTAPFVTKTEGWLNLALKRIITMAVEGGYDKVAFVNGDQSADRYDLSKSVQQVIIKHYKAERGEYSLKAMGRDGSIIIDKNDVKSEEFDDYIGKDLAEKARKQIIDNGWANLQGMDLKVGGEGMKTFYDSIVPNATKALIKKLGGGQMESVQIPTDKFEYVKGEAAPSPVLGSQPGFTITDAMREKVAGGMPMFANKSVDDPQVGISVALLELGKKDWLYESPKSEAKDVAGIAKDKGVAKVREDDIGGGVKEWKITLPDTVDTDTGKTVRGRSAYLRQKGNELWIDAEITGEGYGGSKIYDIGFNYAHNNPGVVFIGDRHGFSKVAMIRRLENMISATIKYGSTDFMEPHAKQVMGFDGVPGFRWEKGDTLGNLRRMIDVSQAAMQNKQPALAAVQYDQPTNQFVDSEGNPLGYDDLHDLAGAFRPTDGSAGAGRSTIQRAALYRALAESPEARQSFLDQIRELPSAAGRGFGAALEGIAYSNKAQGRVIDRDVAGRWRFSLSRHLKESMPGNMVGNILERLQLKSADPEVARVLRGMRLDLQKTMDTAGDIATEVNKLSIDEREMVSDLIEGELKAGVIPPAHVVKMAAMFNKAFRDQTDELVRLSMMAQEASDRWRDKYLPRYYASKLRGTIDDSWADLAGKLSVNRKFAQGIKGKHLMGRGMVNTIPVDELGEWEAEGWEVRDKHYIPGTSQEVHVWRDFTKEERVKMDEIRDAGFRFVMGYMQTQKDIAIGRMYERLALDPKFASDNQKEGWVQVPESKAKGTDAKLYGKLAGKWVPRNLMAQMSSQNELESEALRLYKKALAWWKSNKTVMNPVSHVNNFVSNTSMAHFAGVSYTDVHKYAGAVKDLAATAPMVKEARDAGLFLGSFTDAELQKILPPELMHLIGKIDGKGVTALKIADAMLTFGLRNKMSQAYEFGDKFFKYMLYADARKNGASPEEAVEHAQKYIFTYDDLPLGARRLRDFGLPFFAYTYKAIPALADTALSRPDRFFAPAGVLFLANALGYAVAAGDDDDSWLDAARKYVTDSDFMEKADAVAEEEYAKLPEWMKGRTALGTKKQIRLWTDEASGNPVFLDVSRFIPGGDLMDINANAGGVPWLQPLIPSNPLLSVYSTMFDNKDPFFGKDLVLKSDTKLEAAGKRADYLWKLASPAIAVSNNLWDKAVGVAASLSGDEIPYLPDALGGGKSGLDRNGDPIQPKYAVPQMVGVKARPIDLDKQEAFAEHDTHKLIQDLESQKRSINKNNAYSDRLRELATDGINVKIQRLREGLTVDGNEKD